MTARADLVRSFSLRTIKTLLGTRRSTSKTDKRRPSDETTASRIAAISSSLCGMIFIIPEARVICVLPPSNGSSVAPSSAARPVIAASKTGYCVILYGDWICSWMMDLTYQVRADVPYKSGILSTIGIHFLRGGRNQGKPKLAVVYPKVRLLGKNV
jgi:hypothetical protein